MTLGGDRHVAGFQVHFDQRLAFLALSRLAVAPEAALLEFGAEQLGHALPGKNGQQFERRTHPVFHLDMAGQALFDADAVGA